MKRALVEKALNDAGLDPQYVRSITERIIDGGPEVDADLLEARSQEMAELRREIEVQRARANLAEVAVHRSRWLREQALLEYGYVGIALRKVFGNLHSSHGLNSFLIIITLALLLALTGQAG